MTIKKKLKKPNLVIIIPARLRSERLSKKLLRKINNIPMILRVAKSAINCNLGDVYVATDSKQIFNLCKKNNVNSIITKSNIKSGTDRVFSAYKILKKKYDLIVNLQGDLPIFEKELIKKTSDLFLDNKTDIASAVCNLLSSEINDKNIVKAKVKLDKNNEGFAKDFLRTIQNKENFYHHIGLYVYSPDSIKKFVNLNQTQNETKRSLEQMRAIDNKMNLKVVKFKSNPPSVDTLEDLKKIRLLFKNNYS
ncbi:MAG: 3-deoxy-manno-octulosonate cytidylyltransferase [Alphaproteobacteria bacterium]|nr:3-deoxy-manno-octulosonate cytidylyltransferase [Alphaproteobacteria bacterium]